MTYSTFSPRFDEEISFLVTSTTAFQPANHCTEFYTVFAGDIKIRTYLTYNLKYRE